MSQSYLSTDGCRCVTTLVTKHYAKNIDVVAVVDVPYKGSVGLKVTVTFLSLRYTCHSVYRYTNLHCSLCHINCAAKKQLFVRLYATLNVPLDLALSTTLFKVQEYLAGKKFESWVWLKY